MKTATIAIHESKSSDKVVAFARGYDGLLKYCSERQAKSILKANEDGRLHGLYFTKNGKLRAEYNW